MRSSTRPFGPAVLFAFLALVPMTGALAEDVQVENNASDGSQIEPAGAEAYTPTGKNLNSVPESSSSVESTQAQDSPVREANSRCASERGSGDLHRRMFQRARSRRLRAALGQTGTCAVDDRHAGAEPFRRCRFTGSGDPPRHSIRARISPVFVHFVHSTVLPDGSDGSCWRSRFLAPMAGQ